MEDSKETTTAPKDFLTPKQLAKRLSVSVDTVNRRWGNEPGVLDVGPGNARRILRYPPSLLARIKNQSLRKRR
jgi:hypothetical protein